MNYAWSEFSKLLAPSNAKINIAKQDLMPSDGTTDSFSLNYEKFLQYDEKGPEFFCGF